MLRQQCWYCESCGMGGGRNESLGRVAAICCLLVDMPSDLSKLTGQQTTPERQRNPTHQAQPSCCLARALLLLRVASFAVCEPGSTLEPLCRFREEVGGSGSDCR